MKIKIWFLLSSCLLIGGCRSYVDSYLEKNSNIDNMLDAEVSYSTSLSTAEISLRSDDSVLVQEAFAVFLLAADSNDLQSQHRVGQMYLSGMGVVQDKFKAVAYLKQAAAQNFLASQLQLGKLFYDGIEFDRDLDESKFWFTRASENYDAESFLYLAKIAQSLRTSDDPEEEAILYLEQAVSLGSVDAKFYLGRLVQQGSKSRPPDSVLAKNLFAQAANQGVDAALTYASDTFASDDPVRAIDYLQISAGKGSIEASYNLGTIFEWGINVPQDMEQALYWYNKAADAGNSYAAYQLALLYNNGVAVFQDDAKSAHYLIRASNANNKLAQIELAKFYLQGKGVAADIDAGIFWLQRVVQSKDPYACMLMSYLYRHGDYVVQNLELAEKLYETALEQPGSLSAHVSLAKDFMSGRILPKNLLQAQNMLKVAASYEHPEAFYLLGKLEGMLSGDVNYEKQFLYYKNAGRLGFAKAYFDLGVLYQKGVAVAVNDAKSFYWFAKAAKLGLPQAQYQLGEMYQNGIGVNHNSVMAAVWLNISVDDRFEGVNSYTSHLVKDFSQVELREYNRLSTIYKNNYYIRHSLVTDFH